MECQDNMLVRDTRGQQFIGDPILGAIVLNPDLAVTDIHMNDGAVNTPSLGRR